MGRDKFEAASAIVLITTDPGMESEVYHKLRRIPEVKEAKLLFGEYDAYAKLECSDFGSLGAIVISHIRSIDGVEATKTLTVAPMLDTN